MSAKWFFSSFLIILVYFGVSQQDHNIPNQEVVLEFATTTYSKAHVEAAANNIKQQLLQAGASNINVQTSTSNTLKITYYSVVDVSNIKQILTKDNLLLLDFDATKNHEKRSNSSSKENLSCDCNLGVYEINEGSSPSKFFCKLVLEVSNDSDEVIHPNLHLPPQNTKIYKTNYIVKTTCKINDYVVKTIKNSSYTEPEVRAGPCC